MSVFHFKRYRMAYDLTRPIWKAELTPGYEFLKWSPELLDLHAWVKHQSFQDEVDANVFPCFASEASCRRLMQEITHREGFCAAATWLVHRVAKPTSASTGGRLPQTPDGTAFERPSAVNRSSIQACGTIQGIAIEPWVGSIQNLGVIEAERGKGLGSALLRQALLGFQGIGLERATLEVTCDNFGAVRLYKRLGWEVDAIVYKSVELVDRL